MKGLLRMSLLSGAGWGGCERMIVSFLICWDGLISWHSFNSVSGV
jgi:hypothetical protein